MAESESRGREEAGERRNMCLCSREGNRNRVVPIQSSISTALFALLLLCVVIDAQLLEFRQADRHIFR
jgi:hypothetical protein